MTSTDLQDGMKRLKKVSDKPQSLSEIIESRKSDASLANNPSIKK